MGQYAQAFDSQHAFEAYLLPPMEVMWARAEEAVRWRERQIDAALPAEALAEILPVANRLDDGRQTLRTEVALKCWVNLDTESRRAYVTNLSTDGARIEGTRPVPIGTRFSLKVCFRHHSAPRTCFAQVTRIDEEGATCVQFLEPEWAFFAAAEACLAA